eukprot:SAG31_NODE_8749_length_1395_cov_1.175926_2_plen_399_part_01
MRVSRRKLIASSSELRMPDLITVILLAVLTASLYRGAGAHGHAAETIVVTADGSVAFSRLNLVGERWDNGGWGVLDGAGRQIGTCHRPKAGEPSPAGCQQLWSPSQPPGLLALSNDTVVCAANESVFTSTDGGASWRRNNTAGHPSRIWASVPAPAWQPTDARWMDISPIDVWPDGCSPKDQKVPGTKCQQSTHSSALPNRTYEDWSCSNIINDNAVCEPVLKRVVGRPRPNSWSGLPEPVSMLATSEGGGTQLPDGSYIFVAAVSFQSDAQPGCNCNNSVVAFASQDALQWNYAGTVARFDRSLIYQEGPNECDVVVLRDGKTLWAVMRVDGGDGVPSHRTLPFLSSRSTTHGKQWSPARPLPHDMLAAYPKATVLDTGALLLTAGRPGSDLWISLDG